MVSGCVVRLWPVSLVQPERAGQSCVPRWLGTASTLALAAALCLAAPGARAESLRQAMAAAYQFNPKLDAERARLRATDEEVPRAEAGYRPTVIGQADAGKTMVNTNPATTSAGTASPYGYQVTVRQNLFKGFRSDNAIATAEASVRAGRAVLLGVENATLLDAVTVYMDVVRDQAILKLREANVAVLTKDLEAAETRRSVKEVTRTDVAQAKARRAKAISAADLAKANLKISRANFERIIGHAPSGLKEPALRLKLLPASYEEAIRIAGEESPNVVGALYREEAARHSVDLVRGELMPEVNLEASYGRQYDGSAYLQEQETGTLTGRITMPFYEGGEVHARVRQAKHTHVSRLQEIEQARTEANAQVATAWSRLMAARAQLQSDKVQVEANRVALEGVREEEKVGQRTLLDVLNAEQELLDAQVTLAMTKHDLVVANYAVLTAIGRLTADALALSDTVYDAREHADEVRGAWFGLDITRADGRREVVEAVDAEAEAGDPVQ